MPIFEYVAVDGDGKQYTGSVEAENKEAVATKLQRQRLMVTSVKRSLGIVEWFKKASAGTIKQSDVLLFSRQLSTLVKARITFEQCLDVLVNQTQNLEFKNVIKQIRADVVSGTPLSAALGKYPKIFNNLYIGMIRAGEASGKLPEILVRTARYLDRAQRLKNKITSAMIYPVLVVGVGIGVVVFLLAYVIPQFEQMYSTFKGQLPMITKVMIFLSREVLLTYVFKVPYIFIWFALVIFGIYALQQMLKTEVTRFQIDQILLKLPILGEYLSKVIFARFSQTLGILVGNGVPILESLDLVSKTVGNKPVEAAIVEAKERIKEGEKIAETFGKSAYFPALVVQMINVGEQTGKLGEVLEQISEFYEEEVEIATAVLVSVIEPLLIIGLAGIVALIVLSLYLPIFSMYRQMGKKTM